MTIKKVIILLLLVLLASTAWGKTASKSVNPALNPKNKVIDVRTPSEFMYGHLKNAVNIPYNKIEEDIKYFAPDKEQTVVVYCASGKRAEIAAKRLRSMGYTHVINAGKYKDLKALEK